MFRGGQACFGLLTLLALVSAGTEVGWAAPRPLPSIAEVLDNLRANESLFDKVEVILRVRYKDVAVPAGKAGKFYIEYEDRCRTVCQGEWLYTERTHTGATGEQPKVARKTVTGHDGDKTRIVAERIVNIHHGRYETDVVRPHTLGLHLMNIECPFSTWLEGGEAMRKFPGSNWYKNEEHRSKVEALESVDGLLCVKLRCDVYALQPAGERAFVYHSFFWLSPERNYHLVRSESYSPRVKGKENLPQAVTHSTDFREVQPGVWVPFKNSFVNYDIFLNEPGKLAPMTEHSYTVEKIDLNPQYPVSFFRDIPLPEKGVVYELKDNKIFKSYPLNPQAEEPSPAPVGSNLTWWLVALALCLTALLVGLVLYARHRRSAGGVAITPESER